MTRPTFPWRERLGRKRSVSIFNIVLLHVVSVSFPLLIDVHSRIHRKQLFLTIEIRFYKTLPEKNISCSGVFGLLYECTVPIRDKPKYTLFPSKTKGSSS